MKPKGIIERAIYDNQRIYCVVAQIVNPPVDGKMIRDIAVMQPPGRIAAQVGHVVSLVRCTMLARQINRGVSVQGIKNWIFENGTCPPITTIVLAVRDSFELEHVSNLLRKGISVYEFKDENEEYGEGIKVVTAIATEPVDPAEVVGILDYLPKWKG